MSNYRVRPDCRLCGSSRLQRVVDLGSTPLANEFRDCPSRGQETFPLFLSQCLGCGHVQLPVVVDPERLFGSYVYVSGTSPVFVEHFRRYAEEVRRQHANEGDLVVEIGSNDGTMLGFLRDAGCRVLGVDPAREIAAAATKKGIETWARFFSVDVAREIVVGRGHAKVVVANNVFAHADDLHGIVDGIRHVLAEDGVFVFEVSYLPDVLEKTLLDTIYHEHLSYHSLEPLVRFFDGHGMSLVDACWVPTHGGSVRAYAKKGKGRAQSQGLWRMLAEEGKARLWNDGTFADFCGRIDQRRGELRRLLRGAKMAGKRVAGYGAPAKATTLLYAFDLHHGVLDYVVDDSPLKQGRYLPGTDVPVVSSARLEGDAPDYVVVFAWNFADSIVAKLEPFIAAGGKVVVPLPKVTVYQGVA